MQSHDPPLFQVWLVSYDAWQPTRWNDVPPRATAIEPAELRPMTAKETALYLQGFNQEVLADPRGVWAVPVPIRVIYQCQLAPGELLSSSALNVSRSISCFGHKPAES